MIGLFLRFLRKIAVLDKYEFNLPLTLNGAQFRIPLLKSIGINNFLMDEIWMSELFRALKLENSALLIDIGANVGQTLLKWKSIYPNNSYLGIEPLPVAYDYLCKLTQINQFKNCRLLNLAVSQKTGPLPLSIHFNDPSDRSASLYKTGFKVTSSTMVNSDTLENILAQQKCLLGTEDLVKIDAEGAEIDILLHSSALLKEWKPILILEFLIHNLNADRWHEIQSEYKNHYSFFKINKRSNTLSNLEPIRKYPLHSESVIDVLAFPVGKQLNPHLSQWIT